MLVALVDQQEKTLSRQTFKQNNQRTLQMNKMKNKINIFKIKQIYLKTFET